MSGASRRFPAWIRTGPALRGGSVALESLSLEPQPDLRMAACDVVVAGVLTPARASRAWLQIERALREEWPLPSPIGVPLAIALSAAGVLVLLAVVLR